VIFKKGYKTPIIIPVAQYNSFAQRRAFNDIVCIKRKRSEWIKTEKFNHGVLIEIKSSNQLNG